MKIEEAEKKLRAVLAAPPYRHKGDSTTFLWERPQWKKLDALLENLPPGIDAKLLRKVLDVVCAISPLRHLPTLPAHFDDTILEMIEAREAKDVECAFVAGAMRAARKDRPKKLRAFMGLADSMLWAGSVKPASVKKLIKQYPEVIDGAQAACAVEIELTSRYLPILAVDASPGSLDVLLPFLEAARAEADSDLDWIRKDIVPLFGNTPQAKAWIASLDEAATNRTEKSPAKAWVQKLGSKVPKVVKMTLTFRDAREKPVFCVSVDSTKANWFQGRRNAKWMWRGYEPKDVGEHVGDAVDYILRVGSGLDRAKFDAWAKSLLK